MIRKLIVVALAGIPFAGIVPLSFETCAQENRKPTNPFDIWDKDGDGRLKKQELPPALRPNFDRVDRNRDGFISRKEDAAFRSNAKRQKRNNDFGSKAGAQRIKDVAYIENGHERQKLDLYYHPPEKDKSPRPLVVWIHGGAWKAGNKDRCPAAYLLEHGFAVASINYRLSQHAKFPAQIRDCKSAIIWLKTNASRYNIDPGGVGVWGSSAGGHLAALVGTSADVSELEPGEKKNGQSRVQAVCDWFGPTDLLKMNKQAGERGVLDHDAENSPESLLIGGKLQQHPALAKKVNPISYLSKDDPPFLIMHGDRDFLVPIQQSEMLDQAMKEKGLKSTLVVIKGKGHGGFDPATVRPKVLEFFKTHLMSN